MLIDIAPLRHNAAFRNDCDRCAESQFRAEPARADPAADPVAGDQQGDRPQAARARRHRFRRRAGHCRRPGQVADDDLRLRQEGRRHRALRGRRPGRGPRAAAPQGDRHLHAAGSDAPRQRRPRRHPESLRGPSPRGGHAPSGRLGYAEDDPVLAVLPLPQRDHRREGEPAGAVGPRHATFLCALERTARPRTPGRGGLSHVGQAGAPGPAARPSLGDGGEGGVRGGAADRWPGSAGRAR